MKPPNPMLKHMPEHHAQASCSKHRLAMLYARTHARTNGEPLNLILNLTVGRAPQTSSNA